jgi:ubiquinone/menaquinone biosynthesis C-methylase UbiE
MIDKKNNYVPVIEFYDLIAEEYDSILNQNPEDISIRNFVQKSFLSFVKQGPVIDFGGGTGLDLPWLCNNNFKIYFCEPSEKMRFHAKKLNEEILKSNKIIFLETPETDFQLWTEKYPFPEKANAILLNFSVLNCINDIDKLFHSFSKVISTGGYIFITALDTTFIGRIKYLLSKFYLMIKGSNAEAASPNYQNKKHLTFRHSLEKIKTTSSKYFSVKDIIPMRQRGLMLVQLQRNHND